MTLFDWFLIWMLVTIGGLYLNKKFWDFIHKKDELMHEDIKKENEKERREIRSMNNNLLWLLLGICIGSSFVLGTQFMKELARQFYQDNFKPAEKLNNYVKSTKDWDEVEKEITK